MTKENHTIRLLTEMRNEVREGFERVDKELAQAKAERSELKERMVEGETRLATELISVSGTIQEAKGLIMQQGALKFVVQDHETRIGKLEAE